MEQVSLSPFQDLSPFQLLLGCTVKARIGPKHSWHVEDAENMIYNQQLKTRLFVFLNFCKDCADFCGHFIFSNGLDFNFYQVRSLDILRWQQAAFRLTLQYNCTKMHRQARTQPWRILPCHQLQPQQHLHGNSAMSGWSTPPEACKLPCNGKMAFSNCGRWDILNKDTDFSISLPGELL